MGENLRETVEKKRNKLIKKLIIFNVFKKEENHLFQLSLKELENEYKKFKANSHPHAGFGSIKLNCSSRQQF